MLGMKDLPNRLRAANELIPLDHLLDAAPHNIIQPGYPSVTLVVYISHIALEGT